MRLKEIKHVNVLQLGARMHYAVPRIFNKLGLLDRFYTDIAVTESFFKITAKVEKQKLPNGVRRLLARKVVGVDPKRVYQQPFLGLAYAFERGRARGANESLAASLRFSSRFAERVASQIELAPHGAIYGFNTACLEVFERFIGGGSQLVVEQTIAAKRVETRLLLESAEKYPLWYEENAIDAALLAEHSAREEREWELADIIVCASDFVRDSIESTSRFGAKCKVVPYGVQMLDLKSTIRAWDGTRKLRVLIAGAVGLRKGHPILLEAAKKTASFVEFRAVGPLTCSEIALKDLSAYVDVRGPVPRNAMSEHYQWADLFILPSICEGSATVTYEAIQHGLPLICSKTAGSLVKNNMSGWLLATNTPCAIVEILEEIKKHPELISEMARGTQALATFASEDRYCRDLESLFD